MKPLYTIKEYLKYGKLKEKRGYAKGYRAGIKKGKVCAEDELFKIRDICLGLIAEKSQTK